MATFRNSLKDAEDENSESNHLLAAHMPYIDHDTCQSWYSEDGFEIENDVHKCFGHETGLHDSCQGKLSFLILI